jgi:hypothetical protein
MMSKTEVKAGTSAPIRKSIEVNLPVENAFDLFTDGYTTWWPLKTHSVGEEQAQSCTFESWLGGRIYETTKDGVQYEWGRVLAWDPPRSFTISWYPGRDAGTMQEVEITFSAVPRGTRVELVHRGWERLGELSSKIRAGYETGWDVVLGKYIERAGA